MRRPLPRAGERALRLSVNAGERRHGRLVDVRNKEDIMASKAIQRPGLTTFGWLLLGGAAAVLLGSKERREKVLNSFRGLVGQADTPTGA